MRGPLSDRNVDVTVASVSDSGPQQPPHRDEEYRPAPDYWKAVEARRAIPLRIVETLLKVAGEQSLTPQPPVRLAEVDECFFNGEVEVKYLG
jgi:hypothetical protein